MPLINVTLQIPLGMAAILGVIFVIYAVKSIF
jgi:hypothetical protein